MPIHVVVHLKHYQLACSERIHRLSAVRHAIGTT
jgi:hypothetical protein